MKSRRRPAKLFDPAPRQRAVALDHVYYEIDQLIASNRMVDEPAIDKALLESTLLHTRALLCFLESKQRKQDDVIAGDLGFRARRINGSTTLMRKINNRLAHLTYARCRQTRADQHWDFKRDIEPVLIRSQEFIERLVPRLHKYRRAQDREKWSGLLARVKDRIAYG